MSKNNWFVITGGPSSGKTTVLKELARLGYKTVSEAARSIIDNALAEGMPIEQLRADEKHFQEVVAKKKSEIESSLNENEIIFFDRGMHDTLAYLQSYNFEVKAWVDKLLQTSVYSKVFVLEQLPSFTQDYARTEDTAFVESINQLIYAAYEGHGMKPITIKVASPRQRAKIICEIAKV